MTVEVKGFDGRWYRTTLEGLVESGGGLEDKASDTARTLSRLIAALVERGTLPLQEALDVCGVFKEVREL